MTTSETVTPCSLPIGGGPEALPIDDHAAGAPVPELPIGVDELLTVLAVDMAMEAS